MIIDEQIKGFWFLPNDTEKKVPGILYFKTNREIRLELIGGFETGIQDFLTSKTYEIILGISSEHKEITLLNCHRFGNWNLSSDYPVTNYKCHYMIIGKHLSSLKEKVFDRIQIDFSSLYDWQPTRQIKNVITTSQEDKPWDINFSISGLVDWEKVVQISYDFKLIIFGTANYTSSSNLNQYNLTQNTLFELTRIRSKKSFVELLNKAELFRQFLSLASLSTVDYLNVILFDNNDYHQTKKGTIIYNPISLNFIREQENIPKPKRYQFLFTYDDIKDAFPDIIKKWYSLKVEFTPIRNHLLESIKTKRVFTSLDFLIIIQALEGYHRRFIENSANKKKIFLRTRIEELLVLFDSVKKVHDNRINLTRLVKSRDYYSHFYKKDRKVLDSTELLKLTEQLRTLLISCTLRLTGFEMSLINKLLSKNEKI
jgi:hypothetical protein